MSVDVDNQTSRRVDADTITRLVEAILADQGASDADCGVLLVSPERIRDLNRTWRDQDEATDVLAFPIDETEPPHGAPRLLGDVVICLDTAVDQARVASIPPGRELAVLLVHGTLHLLGYDHETDQGQMGRLEQSLLERLGEVAWLE